MKHRVFLLLIFNQSSSIKYLSDAFLIPKSAILPREMRSKFHRGQNRTPKCKVPQSKISLFFTDFSIQNVKILYLASDIPQSGNYLCRSIFSQIQNPHSAIRNVKVRIPKSPIP